MDDILITGGAGVIGSHPCEYFYKEDFSEVKEVYGSKSEIRFEPLPENGSILRRTDNQDAGPAAKGAVQRRTKEDA